MSDKLTHINKNGEANMVDVGDKPIQKRTARATGFIKLKANTVSLISNNMMKKGDVLSVARIAGIQAAKQTHMLIPLCHALQLTKVDISFDIKEDGILVNSLSRCLGQTGVEMEALTAVNVALLTIYDMCKAVDKDMEMLDIRLVEKTKV
ncbi:cyclic pyranopterin monophosphate synthase MoaC [Carboxylicivirga mesophila]|uniref:Cyclic pyranopterin monophosphate synthase MoaC n=1 Tax=Carboxylicivirga mesophila TaxID=1166478 RepID=A0ABS5K7B3_9BACT|nr:cyclic pyranopterin monophosphate synthase MoaC [Carboxylicivirga mesophila]MBS2210884.1 cyclic pyranopterin monophosphate synthase MoaC [Carboxylicivirga mesophila]